MKVIVKQVHNATQIEIDEEIKTQTFSIKLNNKQAKKLFPGKTYTFKQNDIVFDAILNTFSVGDRANISGVFWRIK